MINMNSFTSTDAKISNFEAIKDDEQPELSLTKAIEDVSQHGYAQTVALEENQKTLSSLKSALEDIERETEMAQRDLRANTRDTLLLEGEIEHLEQQNRALHQRCVSLSKENSNLQLDASEAIEKARKAQEGFSAYRRKMETHRAAVLLAASETAAQKELEEKRELVEMLKQKKEELKEDLENPCGNTVQMEKRKIDALKDGISVMEKIIEGKTEKLHGEFERHSRIKKDIEIQNKRFEAIVRRLHCQMSRAQAVRRQVSEEIYHLKRQLDELKRQQESSQGSAGGH